MRISRSSYKRAQVGLVVGIILIGAFLRLYRLRGTMVFQGDQGRDALIAREIIKEGNFTLIGPVMSVGNIYLGPFYYYFMAPFLALTYPDPIGPVYGVALANIFLLILFYLIARDMFGKLAGMISLTIYAFMVPAVTLSRFSWNPNLAPLVGALIVWTLFKVYAKRQYNKLPWLGLLLGILAQLHYLAMVMLVVSAVIFGLTLINEKKRKKLLIKQGLFTLVVFTVTWAPLIIFNFRHNNLVFKSFYNFLFGGEQHLIPGGSIRRTLLETEGKSIRLLGQTLAWGGSKEFRLITYGGLVWFLIVAWFRRQQITHDKGLHLVLITLGMSVIGISVYSGSIYDHYLGFALPAVALFWGYLLTQTWRLFGRYGMVGVGIILGLYVMSSWQKTPAFSQPGPSIYRYSEAANDIAAQIGQGKYNLALLTESKDYQGMNYRYFLNTTPRPPAKPDDYNSLDKLVVIDELDVPNPLEVKIYEIQQPQLRTLLNQFMLNDKIKVYIYGK